MNTKQTSRELAAGIAQELYEKAIKNCQRYPEALAGLQSQPWRYIELPDWVDFEEGISHGVLHGVVITPGRFLRNSQHHPYGWDILSLPDRKQHYHDLSYPEALRTGVEFLAQTLLKVATHEQTLDWWLRAVEPFHQLPEHLGKERNYAERYLLQTYDDRCQAAELLLQGTSTRTPDDFNPTELAKQRPIKGA